MLSFFPRDVLDEIWDLIESVSEGFLTYFCFPAILSQTAKFLFSLLAHSKKHVLQIHHFVFRLFAISFCAMFCFELPEPIRIVRRSSW